VAFRARGTSDVLMDDTVNGGPSQLGVSSMRKFTSPFSRYQSGVRLHWSELPFGQKRL
jgi:hypothetical protein